MMTLAKTHSENGVTLYLLPRLNMRYYRLASLATEYLGNPTDTWSTIIIDRFAVLEGLTFAPFCEAPDDNPFAQYFGERDNLSILERLERFEILFDVEHINLIYNAYNHTRENPFPLELPSDIDPDDENQKKGISSGTSMSKSNANETANGLTKSATQPDKTATEPSA